MAGLAASRRWSLLARDKAAEHILQSELGLAPLAARVLAARGMVDPDEARAFLSPSLERDWLDPLLIPGMDAVVSRIERALGANERIAIFGDFDVDGMSSTCLLTLALRRLGAEVMPFIPHRFGEGYGLSQTALERVIESAHPDLIITVDNGISAGNEAVWLLDQGIDVVVTDHHEPSDLVPAGVPVTDPKLSPDCPSHDLAGAGVALKLVCELGRRLGQPDLWREYVDVASLGTLSDMMLLTAENRALVFEGVARMATRPRPGILALAATAGIDPAQLTADLLPFSVIPRLNAAGRMGTTDEALQLLLTEDPQEAAEKAAALNATNDERRATEIVLTEEAVGLAEATFAPDDRCVVVAGEGWHEGVKGIVASRLKERFHVPCLVFSVEGGIARGSGRSVGSVDLFRAVEACSDMLVRFGGHAGAVGVTCEVARLDEFRRRLSDELATLPPESFEYTGEVAAEVTLSELTIDAIDGLEALQPFGRGNKKPLLAVCGVTMKNRSRVGAEGAHVRVTLTDGAASVGAIMFRAPDPERACAWEGAVDVVFEATNETWQGRTKPKLMVRDILYRDEPLPGAKELAGELDAFATSESSPRNEKFVEPVVVRLDGREATSVNLVERLQTAELSELRSQLCNKLTGGRPLFPVQDQVLTELEAGASCLAVMATGRGKSLLFQVRAAELALLEKKATVIVLPLRALVSDQALRLQQFLEPLGVGVAVLTGETSQEQREATYEGLGNHTIDVVLTTPEYLALHRERIAACGRVGLLVVDEAHHAGDAGATSRPAYLELPEIVREFGNPQTLAVTATAQPLCAEQIRRLLSIAPEKIICDATNRENLSLNDLRNVRDRDSALIQIVARGERSVVYTTTRDQAVALTRLIRHRVPELANRTAFYHAGLPREVRLKVEAAYRSGELSCVVATSAFGEGVDLAGVRHVVLCGMPFGEVELNQSSGRAGRDGKPAEIHLLFGTRDAQVTERLLAAGAPTRDDLAVVWRALKALGEPGSQVEASDAAVINSARSLGFSLDERQVEPCVGILEELGLVQVDKPHHADETPEATRRLTCVPHPARMELSASARYSEGLAARQELERFIPWVMGATPEELREHIICPILPVSASL